MSNKRDYTTDLNELKVKDFFAFQQALLTLTIGDGYNSLEEIIIKTLTLLAKNRVNDAHQELVSTLTVINSIKENESSIIDGLKALLKSGDINQARYKDLLNEFAEVKKKVFDELEFYFPDVFGNKKSEIIEDVKIRALKIADEILNKNDNSQTIKFHEDNIINATKRANSEKIKQFTKSCNTLVNSVMPETNVDPMEMSVMRFYQLLEDLKKRNRKLKTTK